MSGIRCKESENEVTLSFITPGRRNVTVIFAKKGPLSGQIRIESDDKLLLDENLTDKIQEQAGFLF